GWPGRRARGSRTPVYRYHQRIAALRVIIPRIDQPSLHRELTALPVDGLSLAPQRLALAVLGSDGAPLADGAGPHLGRRGEGAANERTRAAVARHGDGRLFIGRD